MSGTIDLAAYAQIVQPQTIDHIQQLAKPLRGATVVHVNSTRMGGGVAEILNRLIPLKRTLGIDAHWEVIEGDPDFFSCTKSMHNALQGNKVDISKGLLDHYMDVNASNAKKLKSKLAKADFVFIHDPQPAPLFKLIPKKKGKWVWRCHIDASKPHRPVWKFLKPLVENYHGSIFSLAVFAQPLPHDQFLVPPSIDPLSEKNMELPRCDRMKIYDEFGLDRGRPIVTQVSRFDRFKDPVGVIKAYKLAKNYIPLQLVLAGGTATDDPEGEIVLREVRDAAGDDPDIHILLLPPDSHRTINALQRASSVIMQKSTKEGFGLTVTEALWKRKPVIGGETGGIVLQVVDYHTGFLVNTPEGAAFRLRYLLSHPTLMSEMGEKGRNYVRDHFLLTRHLRDYLTIMVTLSHKGINKIEL